MAQTAFCIVNSEFKTLISLNAKSGEAEKSKKTNFWRILNHGKKISKYALILMVENERKPCVYRLLGPKKASISDAHSRNFWLEKMAFLVQNVKN